MSVFEEPAWWSLIDHDAALREQFPSIEVVKRERIGGPADRAAREAHEAAKVARLHGDHVSRTAAAEKSADAFIARMEERSSEAEKRRRIKALEQERRDIAREVRAAERRLSWLTATANRIERTSA